jgi:hypothetical protein
MLPAVTMVGLYAMVSASVPRYNAYMIFYYSLALAWCITLAIDRAQGRRPLPIASVQTEL